jgi:flagellar protein FlgJ
VFLNQVLKQMRQSLPGTDALASDATRMQTALFDQHLAEKLAQRGTGLGEAIQKHLERLLPAAAPGSAPATKNALEIGEATEAAPLRANVARGRILPAAPAAPATLSAPATPAPRVAMASAAPAPRAAMTNVAPAPREVTFESTPAPRSGATDKAGFVDRMLGYAQGAAQVLGVPASFIVGQAAHESGWGRREIAAADGQPSYNLFGLKAGPAWKGDTVETVTTEVLGGVARRVVQRFRAYNSYEEAFADYAKLLSTSPRYAKGVVGEADPARFARALAAGGYATDPQYAAKLERVIASAQAATRRTQA